MNIFKKHEISEEEKIKKYQQLWNSEYENIKIIKPNEQEEGGEGEGEGIEENKK